MDPSDLFGRLSDSDSTDSDEAPPVYKTTTTSIFEDLAMSSSSDEENDQEVQEHPEVSSSQESMLKKNDSNRSEYNSSSVPTVSSSSSSSSMENGPSTSQVCSLKRKASNTLEETPKTSRSQLGFQNNGSPLKALEIDSSHSGKIKNSNKLMNSELDKTPALNELLQGKTSKSVLLPKRVPWNKKESSFNYEESEQQKLESRSKAEKQIRDTVLIANLSKNQLDRYIAFRRSKFPRQLIRNTIAEVTGKNPSEPLTVAVGALAKMFVGELVEEAVELRENLHQDNKPVQPEHIFKAFNKLSSEGKLFPPYGKKHHYQ